MKKERITCQHVVRSFFVKNISKKGLHFPEDYYIIPIVANEVAKTKHKGLSPNGKATDSDSVSSRFESL